jgi:hypothetical protein
MYFKGITIEPNSKDRVKIKIPSLNIDSINALLLNPLSVRRNEQDTNIKVGTVVLVVSTSDVFDSFVVLGSLGVNSEDIYKSYLENKDEVGLISKEVKIFKNENESRGKDLISPTYCDKVEIKTLKFHVLNKTDNLTSLIADIADGVSNLANAVSNHHNGAVLVSGKMSGIAGKIRSFL